MYTKEEGDEEEEGDEQEEGDEEEEGDVSLVVIGTTVNQF